jgi:hypothetical protein
LANTTGGDGGVVDPAGKKAETGGTVALPPPV